jgi:predicted ribosome quality control (RQC) complex YloA/Tae2 family protein
MLCLAELRRAAEILDDQIVGHRVEKIVQEGPHRIVLSVYGRGRDEGEDSGAKRHLLLSCCPQLGRVSQLSRPPAAPDKPPAFQALLRARLGGARVGEVCIQGDDRQLVIRFDGRDGSFALLLSLLGKRSNLYLLDADGLLLAGLRPLEQTRRSLRVGESWIDPPVQPGGGPGAGEDRWSDVPADGYLVAAEESYSDREEKHRREDLAQRLTRTLRKERKLAERRLERIEVELSEADQAAVLQQQGELLKSVLGKVSAGDREVKARDYGTGEEVTIPLDPTRSPKENLELTFKRYQKLLRRLTKAGGQVDAARVWCDQLASLEAEVAALAARGEDAQVELDALAARPEVAKLLGKHRAAPSQRRPAADAPQLPPRLRGLPRKLLPRRYLSADGLEIWVGRNDEGNDHLTTRLARGNDLFFHLDGAPGSHVVLRTEGRSDPPNESVLDACELAVRFSKQKNASRADVHVVPIKQVKKPKGAKRGLVWVTGGKSVHLRRDEKRLQRVLDSKFDDPPSPT